MICQTCHAKVADDLVFCTECGNRLHETISHTPTVLMNDSVVTKISAANQPKSSSNLKWLALIVALIAVPASLFLGYRLLSKNAAVDSAKPANQSSVPAAGKSPSNANLPAASANVNQNVSNANSTEVNLAGSENKAPGAATEIWKDRIEIAPGEHYAVPFKLDEDARLKGQVKLLRGDSIAGFVYLQTQYDEHFPDPTYKMFSFDGKDEADVNARLVKENYVLIFINQTPAPLVIEGNFSATAE